MKQKVLLAIQGANTELYETNVMVLKDMYSRMKQTFVLDTIDVDVISFTAGDKTGLVGDVFYANCLDSDVYLKVKIFISEYLLKHPEYDVIIKTNATTLINLSYINALLKEGIFIPEYFYGSYLFNQWETDYSYISGNFIMTSGNVFRNALCDLEKYDKVNNWFLENYPNLYEKPKEGDVFWRGVPDDTIWGGILNQYHKNITLVTLEDGICLNALWRGFIPFDKGNSDLLFNRLSYAYLKVEVSQEDRLKIEPFLIKSIGKIMLDNPINKLGCINIGYKMINKIE